MATCIDCGKKLGFINSSGGGRCTDCHVKFVDSTKAERQAERDAKAAAMAMRDAEVEQVLLTTETAPSLKIARRIEIVTAECAFGMNIFKDLFAAVRDIVGGRSEAVQKTLRDARQTVLYELKKEAHRVGANAVVAVDLDYVELSGHSTMVLLVASGTAVWIDD